MRPMYWILLSSLCLPACGSKKDKTAYPAAKTVADNKKPTEKAPAPTHPGGTVSTPATPATPKSEKPAADKKQPGMAPAPQPEPQPVPQGQAPGAVVTVPVPVFTGAVPFGVVQDCIGVSPDICAIENQTANAINSYRTARGLMPLAVSTQMAIVGRHWAAEMASAGALSEQDPVMYIDELNLRFGPANVVIGNGNSGGFIRSVSVVSVPVTAAPPDLAGTVILNALIADTPILSDLTYAGFRAMSVSIVQLNGKLWVTVLWST